VGHVQYNVYQHIAVNFLNLVYALEAPPEESPLLKQRITEEPGVPRLDSTVRQKAAIFAKLQAIQPELQHSDTLLVFNPDAGLLPIRAWPLSKYAQLARKLVTQNERTYIVVMGVKGAAYAAKTIAQEIGQRCIDLTNRTTLREVIDLFNIADGLVTNDSGPAHFASLTPIKNFVFFGPETPELYGPLGEHAFPIYTRYSCSPCLSAYNHRNTSCRNPRCVTSIAVDDVYELITTHLKQ
jgi:ADP-heptose:LPS heptosyltransferase